MADESVDCQERHGQPLTMLGDGKPLHWEMKGNGLFVEMPKNTPCKHAFVLKITRKTPF